MALLPLRPLRSKHPDPIHSKRTGSAHLISPPASDVFDPNKRGELDEGLRDELDACYHTQARLDSFPGYAHHWPKGDDPALSRLLAHLEDVIRGHGYERLVVTQLNAYINDATPSCEFRFVYLDRSLDKPKIRPDIAIVHKDCLAQDVQTKRRQQGAEADPGGSGVPAGTSEPHATQEVEANLGLPTGTSGPQHTTSELRELVHTNLDVRMLPKSGPKQVSVVQTAVRLSQMQIVEQRRAQSAPTRLLLPRKAKSALEESAPSGSTAAEPSAAPIIFYSDIVALVEVTFGSKSTPVEMVQAAGYVRETRFSQPFRHFVPCLFMNHHPTRNSRKGWHFRIVHFDSAGYWHNGAHQRCSENKEDFTSVLRYLTSSNIGYPRGTLLNPPCHNSAEKRHPVTILVGKTHEVKLIKFLWIRKNLMGRCTFAYLARDDSGPPFVIKESWPDSNRVNEVEFLKIAADREVPNIALLHKDFRDVDPSAFIVTTTNTVRNVSDTTTPGNRRAVRIPLDRQGFPIEQAESPRLIVAIMYCAISAIRGLSKDLPSLRALNHRDISLTNILLSDREWKSKPLSDVAFITDLDNADYYVAGGGSMQLKSKFDVAGDSKVEHLHRTGTLLYMSQEALIAATDFSHLPRHDLESIYYVAVILACLQDNGAIPAVLHSKWTKGDLGNIGDMKVASILGPSNILQCLALCHTILEPHFKLTFRFLRNFIEADNKYTKSAMLQREEDSLFLDRSLERLEEPAGSIHVLEG